MLGMGKRELEFISIDEKYYGGDQNWHSHRMMKLGGCSAVTACETCIWMAKAKLSLRNLYPFDPQQVTRADFLRFFERMFYYLHPGIGGMTSIDKFAAQIGKYISTTGADTRTRVLRGNADYGQAEAFVKQSLDNGFPVMYLMLKHRNPVFADYEWHWFTLTGYEDDGADMDITFATWGEKHTFSLRQAWDTGKAWRGGMVALTDA